MSFTAQSVIDRARAIWKESATGDVLSDANCLLFLSDGLLEIRSIRPETQQDENGNEITYADVTTSVPLDAKFRPVMTDYLVARGFMGDADSQNHDARANAHFKLFYDRVKVV